jgi:sigma-B regulation protein RsbQ
MLDVQRRNNVTVQGAGPRTLVLAHGLGCDQNVWHHVAPLLARDHRLVLFDYVGSGRSDLGAYDPVRYGSLEGYARDLAEVARLAGPAPVLVGHSISGALGVLASVAAPGLFERMVFLAPSPCFLNHPPDYFGGLNRADVDDFLALMDQNFLGWAKLFAGIVAREATCARCCRGSRLARSSSNARTTRSRRARSASSCAGGCRLRRTGSLMPSVTART